MVKLFDHLAFVGSLGRLILLMFLSMSLAIAIRSFQLISDGSGGEDIFIRDTRALMIRNKDYNKSMNGKKIVSYERLPNSSYDVRLEYLVEGDWILGKNLVYMTPDEFEAQKAYDRIREIASKYEMSESDQEELKDAISDISDASYRGGYARPLRRDSERSW